MRTLTIGGVQVVTIPLSDYAKLLEAQRMLAQTRVATNPRFRKSRSPLGSDPEVVTFPAERFGKMPAVRALEACRSVFGQARTPSRSAADRLWDRLRDEEAGS